MGLNCQTVRRAQSSRLHVARKIVLLEKFRWLDVEESGRRSMDSECRKKTGREELLEPQKLEEVWIRQGQHAPSH